MDDKEELMANMLAARTDPPAIQGELIPRGDLPRNSYVPARWTSGYPRATTPLEMFRRNR